MKSIQMTAAPRGRVVYLQRPSQPSSSPAKLNYRVHSDRNRASLIRLHPRPLRAPRGSVMRLLIRAKLRRTIFLSSASRAMGEEEEERSAVGEK